MIHIGDWVYAPYFEEGVFKAKVVGFPPNRSKYTKISLYCMYHFWVRWFFAFGLVIMLHLVEAYMCYTWCNIWRRYIGTHLITMEQHASV